VNFLADENIDRQIVEHLRKEGHNVQYVAEKDAGIPDNEVLDMANREGVILLTADKNLTMISMGLGIFHSRNGGANFGIHYYHAISPQKEVGFHTNRFVLVHTKSQ
jgi:hypothetical protein